MEIYFRMIINRNHDFRTRTRKLKHDIDLTRTKIVACCTTNRLDLWIDGEGAKYKSLIETRHCIEFMNF